MKKALDNRPRCAPLLVAVKEQRFNDVFVVPFPKPYFREDPRLVV
jgi:hypothetical protein